MKKCLLYRVEEVANRPKWLAELEKSKKKSRLAHEAGAGAPCMNCNSMCPGLDLHFWRKICKNCKCSRDDHDVDDDEFPQFDLLFGPSAKFKKRPMHLQVNNKKQNEGETTFEWVPPDTTKELAMDYMRALPASLLPIKGSAGAALRRQLLQKQLPLHDIDHKACDALSEQEQKQFEKYLENIKKYAGQGKVMKILSARPFDRSLMTPINATDMQRYIPQYNDKCHMSFPDVHTLHTPSSFAVRSPYAKHPSDSPSKQDIAATSDNRASNAEEYNRSLANVSTVSGNIAKSQPVEGKFHENLQYVDNAASANERGGVNGKIINSSIPACLAEQENVPVREMHTSGNFVPFAGNWARGASTNSERHREMLSTISAPYNLAHSEALNSEAASIAESMLADALLPPSAIHANDIIGSTLGEEELMYIREKLADKYNALENPVLHTASKLSRPLDTSNLLHSRGGAPKEANSPASVTKDAERTAIAAAMRNPAGSFAERGELGNATGVPLEAERKVCKPLSHVAQSTIAPASLNEQNEYGRLFNVPNIRLSSLIAAGAFGATKNAADPSTNRFKPADAVISASNPSLQVGSQHPVIANPLQAKLSSSHVQPTVLHSEQMHNQVFPHNVIGRGVNEAVQRNAQYVEGNLKDAMEDLRIDSTRVQKCRTCHEDIRVGDVVVTAEKANDESWHPGCFACSVCDELLVDLVYFYYKDELYCERDLSARLGILRCFACDELIFMREYTIAEGHNYHVKHFCCWDCDMPLAGQKYITENDLPLCLLCYAKTYAKTCATCNTVIAADQMGASIRNLNFHATGSCLCCYSCKKKVQNGKIAIKENKLFCSKECIAKFFNQ